MGQQSITMRKDFAERRILRVEQLLSSWGAMMMDEWANSLYSSRQMRYSTRAAVVKQCLGVYYAQYDDLNETIIAERASLLEKHTEFVRDLKVIISTISLSVLFCCPLTCCL
jgi:hypothetical protein